MSYSLDGESSGARAYTESDSTDVSENDTSSVSSSLPIYTESELSGMTVLQIRQLAGDLGYSLTAAKKADIISEFLEQQNG